MLGLSMLDADLPQSAAIHALTAGAIGTMILAVMTRATRGHTGRDLAADSATRLIYILVSLAAITRVAAAFHAGWTMPLLIISACFWIAAFGGFVLSYGPMLIGARDAR
ncbi:NnrS family protein (fragment) [Methylocella tundrae]